MLVVRVAWQTHGPNSASQRQPDFSLSFDFSSAHFVNQLTSATMAPKAKPARAQENVQLGPQTREGELVFGVARIFASFNDTFVHVTDLS